MTRLQRKAFASVFATRLFPSFMSSSTRGLNDHSSPSITRLRRLFEFWQPYLPSCIPTANTHTHRPIYLYNCIFCKHQHAHQLNPHACTHRQKWQALTHTQMQARIRGSHGGWCAVLCSRIGSSASCELDSPGSVLIPATLFTSPHIHAHTRSSPGPSPAEGFTKFDLFVCSSLSSLSFFLFLFCIVRTRFRLSPCCVHTSQRPLWKVSSISPVSSHARQERVDRWVSWDL